MATELVLHSEDGKRTFQMWEATNPGQPGFELLIGTGGDFPEQVSIRLHSAQVSELRSWLNGNVL
jgi:hypothetical protein